MLSLQSLLESPDSVRFGNKILSWSGKDARPFGYYKDQLKLANKSGLFHSNTLAGVMMAKVKRSDFKYPGRLWLDANVISFWEYPKSKKEFLKFSRDLKTIHNINILSSEWKIELPIEYFEDGEEMIDYELISVRDYLKTDISDTPKQDMTIQHMESPIKKVKRRIPRGVGSKKGKQTWKFQKQFTSENKTNMKTLKDSLNESLNEAKTEYGYIDMSKYDIGDITPNGIYVGTKYIQPKNNEIYIDTLKFNEVDSLVNMLTKHGYGAMPNKPKGSYFGGVTIPYKLPFDHRTLAKIIEDTLAVHALDSSDKRIRSTGKF